MLVVDVIKCNSAHLPAMSEGVMSIAHVCYFPLQARQALTGALKIWWDNAPDWQPALLPAIFVGAKAAAMDRMADTIKVSNCIADATTLCHSCLQQHDASHAKIVNSSKHVSGIKQVHVALRIQLQGVCLCCCSPVGMAVEHRQLVLCYADIIWSRSC